MTGSPSRYADGRNTRWDLVAFSDRDDSLQGTWTITRDQFTKIRRRSTPTPGRHTVGNRFKARDALRAAAKATTEVPNGSGAE